jgi:hypothetical protein
MFTNESRRLTCILICNWPYKWIKLCHLATMEGRKVNLKEIPYGHFLTISICLKSAIFAVFNSLEQLAFWGTNKYFFLHRWVTVYYTKRCCMGLLVVQVLRTSISTTALDWYRYLWNLNFTEIKGTPLRFFWHDGTWNKFLRLLLHLM